jgi:hypothetical protein
LAEEMGQRYDFGITYLVMDKRLNDRLHLEQAYAILGEIGSRPDWERAMALHARINP